MDTDILLTLYLLYTSSSSNNNVILILTLKFRFLDYFHDSIEYLPPSEARSANYSIEQPRSGCFNVTRREAC